MRALGAPIVLDGSHGEGGGALLRTAMVMAALTQQPLRVNSVRTGTKFPGLTAEDLAVIKALQIICSAETVGAQQGSTEVSFLPTQKPRALNEIISSPEKSDQGWMGANVVLCTVLPLLARTGRYSIVTAFGETYGHHILSYDYFAGATLTAYRRLGLYAFPDLVQAGFGRGSRGEVRIEIEPSVLQGVDWTHRGALIGVHAVIAAAELPAQVAERGASHLERLSLNAQIDTHVEIVEPKSPTPGAHVTVWAEFERGVGGATAMGQRGVRMEAVVQSAFDSFYQWYRSDATIDAFLADQIIVAAAIAEGDSTFTVDRLTQRFLTTVWVIKQFLPIRLTVKGQEGEPGLITIRR